VALGLVLLGGIALTAIPFAAMTMHWILMHVLLYAFAGEEE
jgi:hypothetical protein